jgi:type IV pilus assembly protein PilA
MLFSRLTIRGFTLLELMVVIAIISIIASLSAPTLVEEFILLHGSFPTETEFNLIKQTLADDSIAKSISVESQNRNMGNILITLNDSTGITENQYLRYSRDANKNWQCSSDLDNNILPLQCESVTGVEE